MATQKRRLAVVETFIFQPRVEDFFELFLKGLDVPNYEENNVEKDSPDAEEGNGSTSALSYCNKRHIRGCSSHYGESFGILHTHPIRQKELRPRSCLRRIH